MKKRTEFQVLLPVLGIFGQVFETGHGTAERLDQVADGVAVVPVGGEVLDLLIGQLAGDPAQRGVEARTVLLRSHTNTINMDSMIEFGGRKVIE